MVSEMEPHILHSTLPPMLGLRTELATPAMGRLTYLVAVVPPLTQPAEAMPLIATARLATAGAVLFADPGDGPPHRPPRPTRMEDRSMTRPLMILVAEDEQERDVVALRSRGAQDAVTSDTRLIVAAGDDILDQITLPAGAAAWGFEQDTELLEPRFPRTQELVAAIREHRTALLIVMPPLSSPAQMLPLLELCKAASAAMLVVLRSDLTQVGGHMAPADMWAVLPGRELRLTPWCRRR